MTSVKWLERITVLDRPFDGYQQAHAYRFRRYEDDVILCVHNLARSAQAVELDLSAFEGRVPVEMFGRTRFPAIGTLPYLLTLSSRGFFWFSLEEDDG